MRSVRYVILSAVFLLLAGCSTLNNNYFLVKSVDDSAKSLVLTETGEKVFHREIVERENYSMLPEVRKYFTVALDYDPSNTRARAALDALDQHTQMRMQEKIEQFRNLENMPRRTERENYHLALLAQQCHLMGPENPEALRIKNKTSDLCSHLVAKYRQRMDTALSSVTRHTSPEEKEYAYLRVMENVNKTLSLEPDNEYALSKQRYVLRTLENRFEHRAARAREMIEDRRYMNARAEINHVSNLNASLGGDRQQELDALRYQLSYNWSRYLYEREFFAQARERVDSALQVTSSEEALELKEHIDTALSKTAVAPEEKPARRRKQTAEKKPSPAGEIRELIASGQLRIANQLIEEYLQTEMDRDVKAQLHEFRETIHHRLEWYYDLALAYYRQEDFTYAEELFSMVVEIEEDYKLASEYLDKSKSKRKLLERIEKNS
jgi:hypothetical protein